MKKEEVKKAFSDLVFKIPKEYNILVFIHKTDTNEVATCGIGCQACEVEHLIELYLVGTFKHNSEEVLQ